MDGIPVMLVGNKCDEESGKREVSKKTGEALQVKLSIEYTRAEIPNRGAAAHKGAMRKCRGAAKYWVFSLFVNY